MRKVVLHIAVVLTLLNTALVHAFVSPHEALAVNVQKTTKETTAKAAIIYGDSLYKNDISFDVNDFDEYDFDDHDTVKEKPLFTPHFFIATLLTSDCKSKAFCNTLYTHVNFSRIPRYNYITLRVLRI